jgi:16S rRNA G527 N7-methylase RsmG
MRCAAGTPSDTNVRDLVDEQQYKLLLTYLDKVLEFNQHTNLTGILLGMGC